MGKDQEETEEGRHLVVEWRVVAIVALVLVVAILVALIVFIGVDEEDALAIVALSLAILSFGAQLITFIAQYSAAKQQLVDSERINTETTGLLSDMRATTQALLTTFGRHSDKLLDLLAKVKWGPSETSDEESGGSPRSEPVSVEDVLSEYLSREKALLLQPAEPPLSPSDQLTLEKLTTYPPEEEGREALRVLGELPPITAAQLANRARNDIVRLRAGKPRRPWYSTRNSPITDFLLSKGLLELVPPPADAKLRAKRWTWLTPTGIELARLVTSEETPPEWFLEDVNLKHEP